MGSEHSARGAYAAAAALLVTAFILSRVALIATSYDAVANWEEPAFLYSAQELAHTGIAHVFDHQDDLSHGGSIPLLVLARVWVSLFGPSLAVLKGVALLWSAATLIALVAVGWRFVSPRYGLLLGLAYAAISPSAAVLQVTLVGSHPESVLFAALALGFYWRTLARDTRVHHVFALGSFAGLAAWCSYASAPLVAPLFVAAWIRRRSRAALVGGLLVGGAPWIVQNLWLRPHGADQWLTRLDRFAAAQTPGAEPPVLVRVASSFGLGQLAGAALLAALLTLGIVACVRCFSARDPHGARSRVESPWGVAPLAAAAVLGFTALAIAKPHGVPGETWYAHRFYVPLHVTLFALALFGVEALPAHRRTIASVTACAVMIVAGLAGHLPLYGRGNTYQADATRDRLSGCAVFGHAELDRAANISEAAQRLAQIPDVECRKRAFTGLGWALVGQYAHDGDAPALAAAIQTMEEADLRARTCQGARQLMATFYEGAMTEDRRRTGAVFLEHACRDVDDVISQERPNDALGGSRP